MRLTYPLPPRIHGDNLQAEVDAALGLTPGTTLVWVDQTTLTLVVPEGSMVASVAAVVAAHTGESTAEQKAELDADAEAEGIARDLGPLLAKARAVRAGAESFTPAQRDRILAGLVLLVARRLRS